MKKWMILIVCLLVLTGCNNSKYFKPTGDYFDMSGYHLDSQHFYNVEYSDVITMIQDKRTFIVYFGYESCPWCNDLVEVLDLVCSDLETDIYYVDVKSETSIDNKDGLNYFIDYSGQKNQEGENILFFPTVMFIKEGQLVNSHIGTVSGHNATVEHMNEKQKTRCMYLLSRKFNEVIR